MEQYQVFSEVSISSIHPQGWLKSFLQLQRDGLTGHLENAGFPFNDPSLTWTELKSSEKNTGFWGTYEQNAYWIDGMIRCGGLLGDSFLLKKAGSIIQYVLDHPDEDGYLGPLFMKEPGAAPDLYTRWSHAIFFRAAAAWYDVTQEEAVLRAMERHFLESPYDYSTGRNVCNIETMVWLYERTGNRQLLEMAEQTYLEMDRRGIFPDESRELTSEYLLREDFADCHGVSFCEVGKLGAVLYRVTGKQFYLNVSKSALRKLECYSLLIDGVPSSAEFMHGKGALDSHETCVITDFTWMAGYLLMATGEAGYGDMIEKAVFNALPGAVGEDFKSLQYFSSPNQVIADAHSNHNLLCQGDQTMTYRPNPATECCPGNVNRAMPNYAARMWMRTAERGIAAVLYGPGQVTFDGGNTAVTITEETMYPFSERIRFHISLEENTSPARWEFKLRIPGWCRRASVIVNGAAGGSICSAGSFVKLDRVFADGDVVELVLPMDIRISEWPRCGAGIERGPLAYALRIDQRWEIDPADRRSTPDFPAYNVYADSPWNYALILPEEEPCRFLTVQENAVSDYPFTAKGAPVRIAAKARRLKGWELRRETEVIENHIPFAVITQEQLAAQPVVKGEFAFTPDLPDPARVAEMAAEETEDVILVPYGCARMRISVFPHVET